MDNPVFFVSPAAERDNLAHDPRAEPQAFEAASGIPGEQDEVERRHAQRAGDLRGLGYEIESGRTMLQVDQRIRVAHPVGPLEHPLLRTDRKSTRLNSSH